MFSEKNSAGHLLVAFDDDAAEYKIGRGSKSDPIAWLMLPGGKTVPTPYIQRAATVRSGTMASLFQWSDRPAGAEIAIRESGGDVEITARGKGFAVRFAVSDARVECLTLETTA